MFLHKLVVLEKLILNLIYGFTCKVYMGVIGLSRIDLLIVLILTLILKLLAVVFAIYVIRAPGVPTDLTVYNPTSDPIVTLSVWDSHSERITAEYGYLSDGRYKVFVAKPPLFALATRLVMNVSGRSSARSIFIVHTLSTFFSLVWVFRFAELMLGRSMALKIALLTPFSLTGSGFIYILSYHEPFSLTLVMVILYHLKLRNDHWVAFFAALFVLSRSQAIGIILILILVAIHDGWKVWGKKTKIDSRFQIFWKSLSVASNSIISLALTPITAFTIWMISSGANTGWLFAPMYAQKFHGHGFSLRKPLQLVRIFIGEFHPNPAADTVHLVLIASFTVVILTILYLIFYTWRDRQFLPAMTYAVFIFMTMLFVGFYGMPRLLHATILPFVWVLVTHKIGFKYQIVLHIIYVLLSSVMTLIILHSLVIDSFGYWP